MVEILSDATSQNNSSIWQRYTSLIAKTLHCQGNWVTYHIRNRNIKLQDKWLGIRTEEEHNLVCVLKLLFWIDLGVVWHKTGGLAEAEKI